MGLTEQDQEHTVGSDPIEAPAVEPASETPPVEESSNSPEGETEEKPQPETPEFTPDYKLDVYGKEKEVDPILRTLMKDEDSAKKIVELNQKAEAFPVLKERHEKLNNDFGQLRQNFATQNQYVGTATQHLNKKDFDSFFEHINVQQADVMQWVLRKLQEAELPPEQRQQINQQRQLQKHNEMLMQNQQITQDTYQKEVASFRDRELRYIMQRPEYSQAIQSFEQRDGAGAFRKLCIEKGIAHFFTTKQDLPTEHVVQEVMKLIGQVASPMQSSGVPTGSPGQPQAPVVINQQTNPTLPNVNGRSSSPVKKQVRSIDDLKQRAREAQGS